jgi:hypothetical protein
MTYDRLIWSLVAFCFAVLAFALVVGAWKLAT